MEGYTYLNKQRLTIFKLQILNSGKEIWMLALTKLVRPVCTGFREEKMVQTVICANS